MQFFMTIAIHFTENVTFLVASSVSLSITLLFKEKEKPVTFHSYPKKFFYPHNALNCEYEHSSKYLLTAILLSGRLELSAPDNHL